MCIVIDTNCLASVFSGETADHGEFRPVTKWILEGKGKVVYGGSKYKSELRKAKTYLPILRELEKVRKLVLIEDGKVDQEQKRIEKRESSSQFNDAHIVALVSVSGCRIVCTKDRKMDKFVKDASLYTEGAQPPKLYRNRKGAHLLCDQNIAPRCKPCCVGSRALWSLIRSKA